MGKLARSGVWSHPRLGRWSQKGWETVVVAVRGLTQSRSDALKREARLLSFLRS